MTPTDIQAELTHLVKEHNELIVRLATNEGAAQAFRYMLTKLSPFPVEPPTDPAAEAASAAPEAAV